MYKIESMYFESVPDKPEMIALVFRYNKGASTSYIATREKMIKNLSEILSKLRIDPEDENENESSLS